MFLTDLTLGVYQEVDEDGNPVTAINNVETAQTSRQYDMYQLDNAMIVYGDIASLRVYSLNGQLVAQSRMSQYVSTVGLCKGEYIIVITDKNGSKLSKKFLKR